MIHPSSELLNRVQILHIKTNKVIKFGWYFCDRYVCVYIKVESDIIHTHARLRHSCEVSLGWDQSWSLMQDRKNEYRKMAEILTKLNLCTLHPYPSNLLEITQDNITILR